MMNGDVSRDRLLLNDQPVAGTVLSIQIRNTSIQVDEFSRGLSFLFQIDSPSIARIIQNQGARPTCVRVVAGSTLGHIQDAANGAYTGTVRSLKFGFTRKYGVTIFSLAGHADTHSAPRTPYRASFSFQFSFEVRDQEIRSYCFDDAVFGAINSFVDNMISAELLDRTQPQFKGIEVIVRPTPSGSAEYEFTLINHGDQLLPNVVIYPDDILQPEFFGWDSTHMPRLSGMEIGSMKPGQTVKIIGSAAGSARRYQGGWRRFVLGTTESVRAHRAMRVFVQVSALP